MGVARVAFAVLNEPDPTTGGTFTIPATLAGDDLYVWITSRDHNSGIAYVTCTDNDSGGNTYTQLGATAARTGTLFRKRATSGTAGKTITIAGAQGSVAGVLLVVRGAWQGGDPTTNLAFEDNTAPDSSQAGFTPANADSLICLGVSNHTNNVSVSLPVATNPATLDQTVENLSTGGSDCGVYLAIGLQVGGPSATGTISWTQNSNNNRSVVWAIRPDVVTPPTPGAFSKSIAFNIGTGAATTTVTVTGAGFTPQAVQFFATGRTETVDTGGRLTSQRSIGFAANCNGTIKNRCAVSSSEDNKAAGSFNANKMGLAADCIASLVPAGTVDGRAAVTSFTTDGCVLTINDNFSTSLRVIAQFYGGGDITNCAIGTVTMPVAGTVPFTQDVTGLGFTCVDGQAVGILVGAGCTADNTATVDSTIGMGAFVRTTQRACWNGGADDNATTKTQTIRHASDGQCWAAADLGAAAITKRVDFSTWITDGFRLTHVAIDSRATLVYYLVIKGGRWGIGSSLTSTVAGTTIPITDLDVGTPLGGIVVSACCNALATNEVLGTDMVSFGVFDSPTSRYSVTQRDEDNSSTSNVAVRVQHNELYSFIGTVGTLGAAMDLQSLDNGGVTFIQDNLDASPRFFWTLLFGPAVGFVGDPTIPHRYTRARLIAAPGAGPAVNQFELVQRKGPVGATGSTIMAPAQMHPEITHIRPTIFANWGSFDDLGGEFDIDFFYMTLPAGFSPDRFTDEVRRRGDTFYDTDGHLKPDVVQTDGVTGLPLIKGQQSGTGRHGDVITFSIPYQTVPDTELDGGLVYQPESRWNTSALDANADAGSSAPNAAAQVSDYAALNASPSGFTLRARLRQAGAATLRTDTFPTTQLDVVDETVEVVLANAPANDSNYSVGYQGTVTFRSQNGTDFTVTLHFVIETNDGVTGWVPRSHVVRAYTTQSLTLVTQVDPGGGPATGVSVSGLDNTDKVRLRFEGVTTQGLGAYTAAFVQGMDVHYFTSTDKYASKTPANYVDARVTWKTRGVI